MGKGIGLFTYGKAGGAGGPVTETGIRLHAATGKFSSQSQSGATRLTADKRVTVTSVTQEVRVAAKTHVLLTAQGAWLKLAGGNIEVHGPGTMAFKASSKELTGPAIARPVLPLFPQPRGIEPDEAYSIRVDAASLFSAELARGVPYKLTTADGAVHAGILDQRGRTERLFGQDGDPVDVLVGDGDWTIDIAPTSTGAHCDCHVEEHAHDDSEEA